jgi:hypothetical protein
MPFAAVITTPAIAGETHISKDRTSAIDLCALLIIKLIETVILSKLSPQSGLSA